MGFGRLAAFAVMLAGCQAPGEVAMQDASRVPQPVMDDATQTVATLARAANARESGDERQLRNALLALAELGARPDDQPSEQLVDGWRSTLSDNLPPLRGRTLGPAFRSGELPAGGAINLQQTFLAGQSAIIALQTRGGGQVTVKAIDGSERTVCATSGGTVRCRWTPPYTQRHQIRIANPRNGRVRYFISFS